VSDKDATNANKKHEQTCKLRTCNWTLGALSLVGFHVSQDGLFAVEMAAHGAG
jgi:hypothetical protein